MPHYDVIVGNVGLVYSGTNGFRALQHYNQYIKASKQTGGRVSGESIAILRDDFLWREYQGVNQQTDEDKE